MFALSREFVALVLLCITMLAILLKLLVDRRLDPTKLGDNCFQKSNLRIGLLLAGVMTAIILTSSGLAFSQAPPVAPSANGSLPTPGSGRGGFVRRPIVYETVPPELPANLNNMAILVFSKTQAYRYEDAMKSSNEALLEIAQQNGWTEFQTENSAVFSPESLSKFKVVVWNNTSGDILSDQQQAALQSWMENGGGWVGIHNAGGDRQYKWNWYADTLFGANFIGHAPLQWATIHVEDKNNPATRGLGDTWSRVDEWYAFAQNPRAKGYHILLTVDEKSYKPAPQVSMGSDHPLAWWHCVGKGRAFYTALGHRVTAYQEPAFRHHIAGAISWAAGIEGQAEGCSEELPLPTPAVPTAAPGR